MTNLINKPLIDISVMQGTLRGFEWIEEKLNDEMTKFNPSSKEYLVLNNLKLHTELMIVKEQKNVDELEKLIIQAVNYNQLKKKQSVISKLFGGLKR